MNVAPWTAVRDTPNKSVRQNVARRGVVLHHGALFSLDRLRRLTMGEKQVSADTICHDDLAENLIPPGFRAWSLSSAFWDSALRSVETVNATGAPSWSISEASHRKLAEAVAYWATVDGFWPHRDGDEKTWTVLGHREVYTIHGASYATACPGGMDLAKVTRYAQQILNQEDEEMALTEETKEWFRTLIETRLNAVLDEKLSAKNIVLTARDGVEVRRPLTELFSATHEDSYILTNLDKYPEVAASLRRALGLPDPAPSTAPPTS